MQNRSGRQRDLVPTTDTLPSPELRYFISSPVTATRTLEAVRPTAGGQVPLACLLGREFRLEFAQGFRERRPRHALTLPV